MSKKEAITLIGDYKQFDQIPDKPLFGYSEQMQVGLALGTEVARGSFKSVFVFGYQGIGKKAYPIALANELNKRLNLRFSYLGIHCEKFLLEIRTANQAKEILEKAQELIAQNKPIIVAIDEIHYLSRENVRLNPVFSTLHIWLTLLLKRSLPKVMVMGITERPSLVDKSVVEGFSVPLYFDITSRKMISQIIKSYLKNKKGQVVATELLGQLDDLSIMPVSADVIRALSALKGETFENLSEDDTVKAIRSYLEQYVSKDAVEEYTKANHELIHLSRNYTIPYYAKLKENIAN
ncbi:MAG: AAA family ATPase [Candidatus Bathyarchaeota archaeon]|nr:AAA family ATPase [Candidatus Bathyarchaeota archaeon]